MENGLELRTIRVRQTECRSCGDATVSAVTYRHGDGWATVPLCPYHWGRWQAILTATVREGLANQVPAQQLAA